MHQISRHLALSPKGSEITASNLYLGTELTTGDELWDVFLRYEAPTELSGELAQRCAKAGVLVAVNESPPMSPVAKNIAHGLCSYGGTIESFRRTIDQELLAANSELESWTLHSWENPLRVFGNFCSQLEHFLCAETEESSAQRLKAEVLQKSLHRPADRLSFEQQSCTLGTSQARVDLILDAHPQGGRVLLLGDDDLMSLALGATTKFDIDLFEVDPRLVRFIGEFQQQGLKIWRQDLRKGLPQELHGAFDVVLAAPTYVASGMEVFLTAAEQGLSSNGRLYLSTCPRMLEDPEAFFIGLMKRGLSISENHKHFNRYPMTWAAQLGVAKAFEVVNLPLELAKTMTSIPYLYADLFVCERLSSL